MTPIAHAMAGHKQYGAYATFWDEDQLEAAKVAVRAKVPAGAQDAEELLIPPGRCHDCGDDRCPNAPGTFAMKWFAA